jgi:hypothetical protein
MVLYTIPALLALWDTLGRYVGDENAKDGWGGFLNSFAFGSSNNSTFYKNAGSLFLILLIPYAISQMMLIILWLRTAQGHRATFGRLWQELTTSWLWLKLIGITLAVGILTVMGFFLLIIPGVILLWRLFLAPYILIDQKTAIKEAIRRSWQMTKGYAWPIYSVLLVMLLFSLANILPVIGPIAAFLLLAAYSVAPALRYQEIKRLSQSGDR